MKAIVVGSNGYLGQNLTIDLLNRGVHLACYDIHGAGALKEQAHRFSYQSLDITDEQAVQAVDWSADAVYFLAGLTGTRASIEKASFYVGTNELGLIHTLDAMAKQGVHSRILFPSTRLVYKGAPNPLKEDDEKEFKTVYALNKFCCEQLLKIYSVHYGIPYTVFRICVPYGNLGDVPFSYGTIGFLMKQAETGTITIFGDGSQRRTFTHVGDIGEIMFRCLSDRQTENDFYNIGGENYSLWQAAEWIAMVRPATIRCRDWPAMDLALESGDTVFDSRKLDQLLSYRYQYRLLDWLDSLRKK